MRRTAGSTNAGVIGFRIKCPFLDQEVTFSGNPLPLGNGSPSVDDKFHLEPMATVAQRSCKAAATVALVTRTYVTVT